MMEIDYTGIGQTLAVTLKYKGLKRGEDEGKPVKITENDTVELAGDGEVFSGVLLSIENDVCAVLLNGVVTLKAGATPPAVGYDKLSAGASGAVKKDATKGREHLVLRVADGQVTFLL